jgi:hypothetical protein
VFIEVLDGASKTTRKSTAEKNKASKTTVSPVVEKKKLSEKEIKKNSNEHITQKEVVSNIDSQTIELIEDTLDAIGDDEGWAFLGDVGNLIVRKKPEFDPRNYGFTKLTPMLKSLTDIVEIDERELDKKGTKLVFVRLRYS